VFIALVTSVAIVALPIQTNYRFYVTHYYFGLGEKSRATLERTVALLTPLPSGHTSVFVAGLEPLVNPLSYGGGKSLKTLFKSNDLTAFADKPEAELIAGFCAAPEPRRFLRFDGNNGSDATSEIEARCRASKGG